jgi:hypothetical protein
VQFELLKSHEGLIVLGASDDFRAAHEIIHDVNERSPIIQDKEGIFLGLAYDFRKAFEGQRIFRKPKGGDSPQTGLVGFEILWPTLLIQCRMLRVALGYMDSGKHHQALAYALETIIETALQEDFAGVTRQILSAYERLDPAHPYLTAKAESRIEHWYRWSAKEREQGFVELLESLDPGFESMYKYQASSAPDRMSPDEWDAIETGADPTSSKPH